MLSIGQAIDFQSNTQEAQAAEELEKVQAAGFTEPALSFDLGYLLTHGEQWELALAALQNAVKDPFMPWGRTSCWRTILRKMGSFHRP